MMLKNFLFACLVMVSNIAMAQEVAKPGKEHALLAESEGEWTVNMASPEGEIAGKAIYKMAHGGLWLTSSLDMKMPFGPFTGQGLDTYDPVKKKYVAIWVDSMSSTPVLLEGNRSADGKTLTMKGKGPSPDGSSTDYQTVTEFQSKDKHVFKMWMGTLTGEPAMTATYLRKK